MNRAFAAILFLPFAAAAAAAPSAQAILKKSDAIRNPTSDYTVTVAVTDHRNGKKSKESLFRVLSKGRRSSVVQTLEPKVDKGRVLLMAGNDYWGFLPQVSKPIRISMQEKLTGEIANGDLSRANFSGDYAPTLKGTEKIGGKNYHVLELKATDPSVTYDRVKLWVDAASGRPFRADFFAASGRKLKSAEYLNFKAMGGALRPTRVVMRDALREETFSVLEYRDMTVAPLADKLFTKQYMNRFME